MAFILYYNYIRGKNKRSGLDENSFNENKKNGRLIVPFDQEKLQQQYLKQQKRRRRMTERELNF